ncbi:hypothetical protein GCM10022232_28080 [Streptomyces plumbiresistens]|uniref:Uncharacterized protein n=2 Tax=Streptomyces plumbiresistens TaxID=511811 RepID=A0ABP7R2V1_9ACTN
METSASLSRMDFGSTSEIEKLFSEFDARAGSTTGIRRRQLFRYSDLVVHVQDFDHDEATVAPGQANGILPARSAARFYQWSAGPAPTREPLYSTVIVNRMDPVHVPEVRRLFEELDATDFPEQMGTRHRQLFLDGDVYLHIQHFVQADGGALIDQAWKDADPRFIKICDALMQIIPPYDPAVWHSPADSVATSCYRWEAAE